MNLENKAKIKAIEIKKDLKSKNIPCDRFCITGYVERNPLINFRIYAKDIKTVQKLYPIQVYEAISNDKIKHVQIEYLQIQK